MTIRRTPAQSLIEFALLAPVLLVLAVAVWDGGSVLREQLILDSAARAGARLAATGYVGSGSIKPADMENAVRAAGADLPLGASDTVAVDPVAGTVTASHTHALYTPLLRRLWGHGSGTVTLQAQAKFYVPVPALSPARTPGTAPPVPCTFDLNIPALSNNAGYFAPPITLATRTGQPGYFVDRILISWTGISVLPIKNVDLMLFAGNPDRNNPGTPLVDVKHGGPTSSVSIDVTSPTTAAGSTYTVYFYNFGAPLNAATVGTITFLAAGCP